MADFDIEKIRAEIPALEKSIYMNTGGSGPLTKTSHRYLIDTYDSTAFEGPDIPSVKEPIKDELENTRQTVASLFNVTSDEIAFTRCVSEGLSTVAYGMEWNAGDEVIISDEEHPSGIIIWLSLAEQRGIKIRKLRIGTSADEMLASLEELMNERTRLVCLSHVTTDTGTILPAKEMCDSAHARGIPVALDAAQSAGQFAVDLRDMNADFYACTGHKWLLGGWGTGMLYVRNDWIERLNVSWTGAGAGAWNRETDELVLADTAHRFEFGGRHDPLYNAMGKGIEFVQSVGIDNIEERVTGLAGKLKAAISEILGATLRSPESSELSTGIVAFSVDGIDGVDLNGQMFDRYRVLGRAALNGSAMRLSTAFFTSDEEIDTITSAISTIANENK